MDVKVKKLSADDFKKYGQVIELSPLSEPTMGGEEFGYWKQQAVFKVDGATEIGVLKVKRRDMVFSRMEKHTETPEILISFDGALILPVAPLSDDVPAVERIEAFEVPKNYAVVMAESCWHALPGPVDKDEVTILVVFKDNTSQNDLVIEDLSEQCSITA